MKDLIARPCSKDDLPKMIELIDMSSTIYGIDLKSSGIRDLHVNLLNQYFNTEPENIKILGVFDSNNKMILFTVMRFWDALPAWDPVIFYSSNDPLEAIKSGYSNVILTRKMLEIAESRGVYSIYIITRYSKLWKRINLMFAERFPDYTISEVEIIEPHQESKWPAFRKILGPISGKQEKSLVILHLLKEHQPGSHRSFRNWNLDDRM